MVRQWKLFLHIHSGELLSGCISPVACQSIIVTDQKVKVKLMHFLHADLSWCRRKPQQWKTELYWVHRKVQNGFWCHGLYSKKKIYVCTCCVQQRILAYSISATSWNSLWFCETFIGIEMNFKVIFSQRSYSSSVTEIPGSQSSSMEPTSEGLNCHKTHFLDWCNFKGLDTPAKKASQSKRFFFPC